ncbi:MAG: hypothetical protein AAF297_01800 [Planctomycetota bacterium]
MSELAVETQTEAAVDQADITIDGVEAILADSGYEVSEHDLPDGGAVLRIRDPESGVVLRGVLEGEILFLTISCMAIEKGKIGSDLMQRMLDAGNGISTSSFQLYDRADGKTAITLNNFCKLQTLGDDDRDDILSCVEFLMVDVMAAREIVGDLA